MPALKFYDGANWITLPTAGVQIYEQPNQPNDPTPVGAVWIDTDDPNLVTRVKASTGWVDLQKIGPQGPPGPQGVTGAGGPTGSSGAKGDPGPWRGTWSAGTAYAVGDSVNYTSNIGATSTYRRKVAGTTATAPDSDSTNWDLIASGGIAGAQGGQAYSAVIGDGSSSSFTVAHNFASRNVVVSVYRTVAPYDEIVCDIERTDLSTATLRFASAPTIGQYTVAVAAPGTQSTLNVTMDSWHTVGQAGEPAFGSGWDNWAPATSTSAGFRKYPTGRVSLRGFLWATTAQAANAVIFTLPVGYRPPKIVLMDTQISTPGVGRIDIQTNGDVRTGYALSTNTWILLDGLSFDTEGVLQAATLAATPMDPWHYVGQAGEPAFTPGNGWVNFDTSIAFGRWLRFRKYPDGKVRLIGTVKSGTNQTTIFTLPVGYRPASGGNDQNFPISASSGAAVCQVFSDGRVIATNVGASNVSAYTFLDSVEFDTETVNNYATGTLGLPIGLDSWHVIGTSGEPTFQNSWVNTGGAQPTTAFRKDNNGRVFIRGTVLGGASGSVAFTLPVGYRPAQMRYYVLLGDSGVAGNYCNINPDGTVQVAKAATNVYFGETNFDTDTVLFTASVAAQPLDNWHYIGNPGEPAFATGGPGGNWVNAATGLEGRFRKYPDGRVRLAGLIRPTNFVTNDLMFTLPVGYRPPVPSANQMIFTTRASGSAGTSEVPNRVDIFGDGRVVMVTGGSTNPAAWVALDAIEFDTATVNSYASGVIGPSLVTALPANPVDGQECYYQANVANGINWHLRYRAANATPYKWEFVGGSDLSVLLFTDTNYNTGTSTYVTAPAPILTLPLAGAYDLEYGLGRSYQAASGGAYSVTLDLNGTAGETLTVAGGTGAPSGYGSPSGRLPGWVASVAGSVLKLRVHATSTMTAVGTHIIARPVRVG